MEGIDKRVAEQIVHEYDLVGALGGYPQPLGQIIYCSNLAAEKPEEFFAGFGEPEDVTGDESREALLKRVTAKFKAMKKRDAERAAEHEGRRGS